MLKKCYSWFAHGVDIGNLRLSTISLLYMYTMIGANFC